MVRPMEQTSLPKHVRCEYNHEGPFSSSASSSTPISRRRGSIRALCIHLSHATNLFQISLAPRTFFALDQTTNGLPFARHARRYDQRKIRTTCGKRPVTTPTDHPSSTNQAAGLPEAGPISPGTSGHNGPSSERIRGELLKLDRRVSKRSIQKYMRQVAQSGPVGRAGPPSLSSN
jgi:hypothetical protein